MADDLGERAPATSSRRSLLAAAAAGAAGVVAAGLATPAAVLGATGEPILAGQANSTGNPTLLTASGSASGLQVTTEQTGTALNGTSTSGIGVYGVGRIGVYALGSTASAPAGTTIMGVFARVTTGTSGPAVVAEVGPSSATSYPLGVGLFAHVSSKSQHGIYAYGGVKLPDRSGKGTIKAGKSSVVVTVPGITTSNFAIATLASSRSGRWVRSVVCAAGKITITLNTTVSSTTRVSWLVLG